VRQVGYLQSGTEMHRQHNIKKGNLYTQYESIQACAVTATSIFNLNTTWNGQLQAPSDLPPEKEPLVPTELEAGWTPERVWTSCEDFTS